MSGHKRARYLKRKDEVDAYYKEASKMRQQREKAKRFLKLMFEWALKEVRR